jgi:DnaJ-class molecular chaperone
MSVDVFKACSKCGASGKLSNKKVCPRCQGTGKLKIGFVDLPVAAPAPAPVK